MYKVAIYSRKSKLTEKGDSIQNQIDLCKQHINNKFNACEFIIYEDEGYSGGNANRPQFKLMIEDAKKNKFDILICYRLDRVSRNISDFSGTIELLNNHNISFISVKEQFDTSTPMGRAMMYIASVFAQLERETIAERIRDNMLSLARSGRWLGGQTPTGFKSEPIIYYDSDMNKKKMYKLSPIKDELSMVKNLYSKYIELKSLSKLESFTLQNNIKTKNNKDFDKSSLKSILTNPVYAIADELVYEYFKNNNCDIPSPKSDFNSNHSIITYNKQSKTKKNTTLRRDKSDWIIAIGKHKGIIPSDNWIKVQYLLESNSKKAPRLNTGSIGLITPLLICKECGSKMRVSVYRRKGVTYYYYRCLMKERSKGSRCNSKNLLGSMADEMILKEIKNISINQNRLYHKLNHHRQSINSIYNKNVDKKDDLEKELKLYEQNISNLTLQISQNQSSTASKYLINQIEEFDNKINEIKKELNDITEDNEITLLKKINIDLYVELLTHFSSNIDSLTFEEKKQLLNELISNITWDGEKLEIFLKG
ncbi:recombinase family protein [Tepidibacter hydrothermalis]|uniref:Recombinase family protein n=1 Tax=Tepidibacter hydrothermalis TaxID=3036126 RepID=A0ABY8EDL0_9FIRM|nr:recombinase family protein [Tepidibacter hydrothermalis]WFD11028.1 recombinase family protein [Tepidibacter hydrothermalis]